MERALELGHEVVAVARRPEVITPAERLSTRQDVFEASSMAKAIAGTDVVTVALVQPVTSRRVPPCRRES